MNKCDSNKVNYLIFGKNGQLGRELDSYLSLFANVVSVGRDQADFSDPLKLSLQLDALFEKHKPDIVLNAAAYTNVDRAESDVSIAMQVNAQSPGVLASFAQRCGAILVHFSSDYIFDGSGNLSWNEGDEPAPISVYGATKWLGEQAVKANCDKFLIFRTSWVIGSYGSNFLKTILRLASEKDALTVVADQYGVPTSTKLLVRVLINAINQLSAAKFNDPRWGVYNCAPTGETNWFLYAQYVISGALKRGLVLKVQPNSVQPIRSDQYPLPAARPANSRLNTQKLRQVFQIDLPPWEEGVDEILDELIIKRT